MNRDVLLTIRTLTIVILFALPSLNAADAPIVLDSRKQLFLDDYLIASFTRVKRTVEQAQKFVAQRQRESMELVARCVQKAMGVAHHPKSSPGSKRLD